MKLLAVGTTCLLVALTGCGKPKQTWEIAQCPDPVTVSNCIAGDIGPSCTFENTANFALSANLKAWSYNKDGVQLDNYPVPVAGFMPGQKKITALVLGDYRPVTKVVVCSIDPEHPLGSRSSQSASRSKPPRPH
jgi:hypothetical protein